MTLQCMQPWLAAYRTVMRHTNHPRIQQRTFTSTSTLHEILGLDRPAQKYRRPRRKARRITVYPSPRSARVHCKDPIAALTAHQLTTLDPTGARRRLFARKTNAEAAKVGDILLARMKNGEPFAGVCIDIRSRGIDSSILLRNTLTRVGVEMWVKIFSPNVQAIEVVQRAEKRKKRARLYYMRQPKHDVGSVQGVVTQYIRKRQVLRSAETRGRDANADKRKTNRNK